MTRFDKKRILVAGGAGFLGINLCRNLLEEGHEVICLDNFSSGDKRNLDYVMSFKKFSFIEQDLASPISVNVDEIYNMACIPTPAQYAANPFRAIRTCTQSINNILNLAAVKRARVFQASSNHISSNTHTRSQPRHDFVHALSTSFQKDFREHVDGGQDCAETLCLDFQRANDIDLKIGRIFNTYGPYMQSHDGGVVSNFIVQALLHRPITIFGDGSQTRSLCYVDDLVIGIKALMASPREITGPVNLGNPNEFTVLELAEKIVALTGSSSIIELQPLPQDDPVKRAPDISTDQQLLRWKPRIDIDRGLEKTIAYFEEKMHKNMDRYTVSAYPRLMVGSPLNGAREASMR